MLLLGILGMALILFGFFLEEFTHHTRKESLYYNAVNILGSGLLVVYAWQIWSLPFLLLNAIWLLIAVVKSVQILAQK